MGSTREFSTLGALVLARFTLGVVVAVLTEDVRLVLAKGYVITFGVAVVAALSLACDRPLIARIRRELSADRDSFDDQWRCSPEFRLEHRRLTWMWIIGLFTEVVIALVMITTAPLNAAVVVTTILSPVTLITLIAVTDVRGRRSTLSAVALGAIEG